jgi:2-keto-4-pentenoate hydratase/2-oxohepta-3-ene-1,7-dioic acid hydratase in catechol pathway
MVEEDIVVGTLGMGGPRTLASYRVADVTLLAPAEPTKIVCVGRNYREHVREMGHDFGGDLPSEPGLFLKGPNALADPGAEIPYPSWTSSLHYEGELAAVVGRRISQVSQAEALAYVLGYTCALDITARDKQRSDLQWFRAKSSDAFCPLGPWIETELSPGDLALQTRVNGAVRQSSRTSRMIFDLPAVISYVSQFMTLEPGDVILTGTPEGVGELHPGDQVEVEVEGVGVLRTSIA